MNPVLQNRIETFTPKAQFNESDVKPDPRKEGTESKIDFLSVLNNSNSNIREERLAKESGGQFSGKESYEDFLKKLEDQTRKDQVPKNTLDKDDFLKLFVEQLKNQDPLDPEKGTEMASKMAHFNSLEQMMNMNKSLDKMADAHSQTRNLDLVNYVGKEVKLAGGKIRVGSDSVTQVAYEIGRDASEVEMEVRDSAGQLVFQKPMNGQLKGVYSFDWDGKNNVGQKLPEGNYSLSIKVKDINSADIPVRMSSKTQITGVDLKEKDGGVFTPLGRVDLNDIEAIGSIDFDKTAGQAKEGKKAEGIATPAANAPSPEDQKQPLSEVKNIEAIQEAILRSQLEAAQS
jgi:flagellar hook assembly protein FlgD